MSSINPNNINGQYPVAGQDNDSQGFRDNFTNIKNNLTFAKSEIEDLQSKVLVTSALDGFVLDNDLNNTLLKGAQLIRTTETLKDLGPSAADITINWEEGHYQYFELTDNANVTFSGFPESGYYAKLRFMVNVTGAPTYDKISFTNILTYIGLNNILGGSTVDNSITFSQNGKYVYEITRYGTDAIYIHEVAQEPVKPLVVPYQYVGNVANANVISINSAVTTVIIEPNAAIATANIRMPGPTQVLDGHTINFAFGNTITAVTHYGNGATILGGITTANVNAGASFMFRSANNTWYRTR